MKVFLDGLSLKDVLKLELKKELNELLETMLKWEKDLKTVIIINQSGNILAEKSRISPKSESDDNLMAGCSGLAIYLGYKKIAELLDLGKFSHISEEFDEGRFWVFPFGAWYLIAVGDNCPGVGGMRLILKRVRSQLEAIKENIKL